MSTSPTYPQSYRPAPSHNNGFVPGRQCVVLSMKYNHIMPPPPPPSTLPLITQHALLSSAKWPLCFGPPHHLVAIHTCVWAVDPWAISVRCVSLHLCGCRVSCRDFYNEAEEQNVVQLILEQPPRLLVSSIQQHSCDWLVHIISHSCIADKWRC